jgi:hypothetical protein
MRSEANGIGIAGGLFSDRKLTRFAPYIPLRWLCQEEMEANGWIDSDKEEKWS